MGTGKTQGKPWDRTNVRPALERKDWSATRKSCAAIWAPVVATSGKLGRQCGTPTANHGLTLSNRVIERAYNWRLLKRPWVKVSGKRQRPCTGSSALNIVEAVEKGDLKALKRLVEAGADVDAMYGEWTALMLAAANRDIEAIRYLLSKGADTELKFRGPAPHITAL